VHLSGGGVPLELVEEKKDQAYAVGKFAVPLVQYVAYVFLWYASGFSESFPERKEVRESRVEQMIVLLELVEGLRALDDANRSRRRWRGAVSRSLGRWQIDVVYGGIIGINRIVLGQGGGDS
jgi:hypothetical protein